MIRLIVSDLDGCLFDGNGHLPEDFEETFQLMQRNGVVFAAASGRSVQGVAPHFAAWDQQIAMITDNGACGFLGGKRLWAEALPKSRWFPVVRAARTFPGLRCIGCGMDEIWLEHTEQLDETSVRELKKYYPSWRDVHYDDLKEDLIKLALFYYGDIEKDVYPQFSQLMDQSLSVKVTSTTWIDVFDKRISKGRGVALLQEKLGISKEETIVFGDYPNDLSMAEYAFRSFAPSNAHPDVKACFTDVIRSNLEGGVTETIRKKLYRQGMG